VCLIFPRYFISTRVPFLPLYFSTFHISPHCCISTHWPFLSHFLLYSIFSCAILWVGICVVLSCCFFYIYRPALIYEHTCSRFVPFFPLCYEYACSLPAPFSYIQLPALFYVYAWSIHAPFSFFLTFPCYPMSIHALDLLHSILHSSSHSVMSTSGPPFSYIQLPALFYVHARSIPAPFSFFFTFPRYSLSTGIPFPVPFYTILLS
jgi:hypothetical protein